MVSPSSPARPQWNGHSGNAWVDLQPVLDAMFMPFQPLLLDAVRKESAHNVLDVGCGTGGTTLAIGREPGIHGTGVDISELMIAVAQARAVRENIAANFIQADAQAFDFRTHAFDMLVSRFGVMFFTNPVEAFANLRRAMRDRGLLNVIAWRSAAENPFMTAAERAAASVIELPPRQPGVPGQFALADGDATTHMLRKSGWHDIDIQPIDVDCTLPENELAHYFSRLGPVGMAMHQLDDTTRARVIEVVRPAFDPYVHANAVRYTAACWVIRARAPSPNAGSH